MGDDGVNARSVRGRGEGPAEDVSGVAAQAEAAEGDFDAHLGDREVPKWIRPALWAGIPVALLALYLFVLPLPIIYFENNDLLSGGGPKFYAFMEAVFRPISWLYENVEAYRRYIDWWEYLLA